MREAEAAAAGVAEATERDLEDNVRRHQRRLDEKRQQIA
eukprot:gene42287-50626_t